MFTKSAKYYDAIYNQGKAKGYASEALKILEIIRAHNKSDGRSLLDVACGTGLHLGILQPHFDRVAGLDLDPSMVALCKERLPNVPVHECSMSDFDLGEQFDVVTCLFSSIGYLSSIEEMQRATQCIANHLKPGGVAIVEPWFEPGVMTPGMIHSLVVDEPDLKITRMNHLIIDGRVSSFVLNYLIGTPTEIEHFTEPHTLTLFTREEHLNAFAQAHLDVEYDEVGLMNRGLYIASKPLGATGTKD